MSRGVVRIAARRARGAGTGDSSGPAAANQQAMLQLLLATLTEQRRTTLALYRLVRNLAGDSGFPNLPTTPRRRSRLRTLPSVTADLPANTVPALPVPLYGNHAPDIAPRTPRLRIYCFGRFEVLRDGRPIQRWRRNKAKVLLKYLVVRRQPVPRDVLLDLLWPDADPSVAVSGLRVALHALRQDLGPCDTSLGCSADYVIYDGGNYLLNPEAQLWVDVEEFTAHFEAGRQLERQQPAEAMRHYELTEAVYRDDYLLEDVYEDWTLVRREELKDQYLMVLTKLADHCFQQGDPEGCIVRCHRILQRDTCREDAYQRLIRCYLQLGQRSQARHWYDLCVRTLRQELDVAPSEQTRRLLDAGLGMPRG